MDKARSWIRWSWKGDVNIIITILFTILQNPHEFMELVGALVVYNITTVPKSVVHFLTVYKYTWFSFAAYTNTRG